MVDAYSGCPALTKRYEVRRTQDSCARIQHGQCRVGEKEKYLNPESLSCERRREAYECSDVDQVCERKSVEPWLSSASADSGAASCA
jgi:hypothetical protein